MNYLIFIAEQIENGDWIARADDGQGGLIITCAETKEELDELVADAVECHFGDGELLILN